MTHILVTGANGQVGKELTVVAHDFPEFQFTFTDRNQLDITDAVAIGEFFETHPVDYCINAAAYTAVDQAESEASIAHAVNATAVAYIAKACQQYQCKLLHLSTDYVYDGSINRPLLETDPVHPQGVYAASKREGERWAQKYCKMSCIVRTSWVYSSFAHNFVKSMLRLGQTKESLSVVYDQVGTPTYARHLAEALLSMIRQVESGKLASLQWQGIFHYSNEGVCSWYDFARTIFRLSQLDCKVLPILSEEYPTAAQRPHYSLLHKGKIKSTFGLQISHWEEALSECLQVLSAADYR